MTIGSRAGLIRYHPYPSPYEDLRPEQCGREERT